MTERHNGEPRSFLPVVKPETYNAALQDTHEMADAGVDRITAMAQRMTEQQPYLSGLVGRFIMNSAATPAERDKMLEATMFLYDLLSKQAEADAMNHGLGETPG